MTDRQPMDHKDWCRLSRVFVSKYNKLDSQDMRINEFLKEMIVEAKEGRADPVAEYARLVLETTLNCHKRCQQRIAELEAANHRLSAEPRLELVGGEWEQRGSWSYVRWIGPYRQEIVDGGEGGQWSWANRSGILATLSEGTAPTGEAAIKAAEKALLEEVKKFVRIKL